MNSLLNNPLFIGSEPFISLHNQPLGFMDIGARGGIHKVVDPIAATTAILAFEPDAEECQRIMMDDSLTSSWAKFDLVPSIVAKANGVTDFNVYSRPVNSSLLKPNQPLIERYHIPGYEIDHTVQLPAYTLDKVVFEQYGSYAPVGEFIKLDAQGAELDILRGGLKTISERSVALIVEVEFCQLYAEQPLFAEVDQFMRAHNFSFYGFSGMSYRANQMRDMLGSKGRSWKERLIHADAIFFKDSLLQESYGENNKHAIHILFVCALLLGYYDFALDLALNTWASGNEAQKIEALLRQYAGL